MIVGEATGRPLQAEEESPEAEKPDDGVALPYTPWPLGDGRSTLGPSVCLQFGSEAVENRLRTLFAEDPKL